MIQVNGLFQEIFVKLMRQIREHFMEAVYLERDYLCGVVLIAILELKYNQIGIFLILVLDAGSNYT
jgi:hypothetical protein